MSAAPAPWTGAEICVLTAHYPTGGTRACLQHLPARSKAAIRGAASDLGLKRLGRKPGSGGRRATLIVIDEFAELASQVSA